MTDDGMTDNDTTVGMTHADFNKLTPYQQEQLRFQGWVVVALERVYDLLLAGLYQQYGQEFVSNILADHTEHKYMFPEPASAATGNESNPEPQSGPASQPDPSGDNDGGTDLPPASNSGEPDGREG